MNMKNGIVWVGYGFRLFGNDQKKEIMVDEGMVSDIPNIKQNKKLRLLPLNNNPKFENLKPLQPNPLSKYSINHLCSNMKILQNLRHPDQRNQYSHNRVKVP